MPQTSNPVTVVPVSSARGPRPELLYLHQAWLISLALLVPLASATWALRSAYPQ